MTSRPTPINRASSDATSRPVHPRARLCYVVTHSLSTRFLDGQLAEMRSRGFDVTLIASPGPGLASIKINEQIETVGLPMRREIHLIQDFISLVLMFRQFLALRPDIVNAGTPKAGILGMFAAWAARVPVRIYTLHGLRLETTTGLKRVLLTTLELLACRCATRVICVSPSLRERGLSLKLASADKLVVLGSGSCNGLDISKFHPTDQPRGSAQRFEMRQTFGLAADAIVLGAVGRLTRDKGVEDLIAAYDQVLDPFPNARLVLVGDFESGDPLPADCIERIKTDPRICWTGFIDDVTPYYSALDVLVHASHREGLGYVPLEAAAAAIPVVAYQVTGIVDAVRDGETGCLVPVGDTPGLSQAICRYLTDSALRYKHGLQGRARMEREFDRTKVWTNLRQEYQRLLDEHKCRISGIYTFAKRVLDITIATSIAVLLSPLLACVALIVRWRLGGPVIFWQQRPGLAGRPFWMPKFRTMTDHRDSAGTLLPDAFRLTGLGKFLRSTSLDELPELWCVLRGEMSLVGPRPLLMEYLVRYTPEQARRHEVKPGITGLAQVSGRNAISWRDKFDADVRYVDSASFWLDVKILWRTVAAVFGRQGISAASHATMPLFTGNEEQEHRNHAISA